MRLARSAGLPAQPVARPTWLGGRCAQGCRVATLKAAIDEGPELEGERMSAVIEVQHLHKGYGDTVAVDDVSFSVADGEIFGILGPNGAGKTTTVECIEGLRTPDRGAISVLGLNPRRDRAELTQRLGAQLQDSQLPDRLRVAEALQLYGSFYRAPADWRALMNVLGLAGQSRISFGKLSGGQRQRVSIALALIGNPQVVVLDELTTGLDPQARRDTWERIEGLAGTLRPAYRPCPRRPADEPPQERRGKRSPWRSDRQRGRRPHHAADRGRSPGG
jgi:ABC-type Na+ transport system ATPase subunit NatA